MDAGQVDQDAPSDDASFTDGHGGGEDGQPEMQEEAQEAGSEDGDFFTFDDLPEDFEVDGGDLYETVVAGNKQAGPDLPEHRAVGSVSREDLERRLPRSAPDALRYEPGVFVQQTAHGQGSAFIRGLTGQQTLMMFDGIRLNNSTYRQGPNQYLFTLDSQTIESIQIMRGGASTHYGSDALGGVILVLPLEAHARSAEKTRFITYDPLIRFKGATADWERGGRGQTNLTVGKSLGIFGGVGGRRVGRLESGGMLYGPDDADKRVPRFESDNRTQLGTGFDELTGDVNAVYEINRDNQLKVAAYFYRQYDSPRTDQCPAPRARHDECLNYDEQFRTLVYGAWTGKSGLRFLDSFRSTVSWQRQHERRTLHRPVSFTENLGRDDVDTLGATLVAQTRQFKLGHGLRLKLDYGVDTYHDRIRSASWITFTDINYTGRESRGQYLDNSRYTYGGAFFSGRAQLFHWLFFRAGGRLSWIDARAPQDPESGSRKVDRSWFPLVGNAGLEARFVDWFHLLLNVDHSFRAPNLDDMTSRQQTGSGFQFENPDLNPETADTFEAGLRFDGPVTAELWAFWTLLRGAVVKELKKDEDCPDGTINCLNSWSKLQLVNADGLSEVRGLEGAILAELPSGFWARATASWTFGEGPGPSSPGEESTDPPPQRVPLSRIPPLNGTMELQWRHLSGFSAGASMRWATRQDRLAPADRYDGRIPTGGTPGFAVFDVRLAYRDQDSFLFSLVFENVFDAAYRYHGSSLNGPGWGVILQVDLGPYWRHWRR